MNKQYARHFILLRGLTRESGHWGDFAPLLQSSFAGAKITQLDLPGAGPYFRDVSPASIGGVLDSVRARAGAPFPVEHPAMLIGVSLGGMVAWEWLQTYPDEVCGAVLINISLGGLSPFFHRLRWQCYGQLLAAVLKRRAEDREPALLKLLSNRKELFPQVAEDWIKIQKLRPVGAKNACRQLLAAATYAPESRKPPRPVLLLNSLGDKLVAPCCSEAIKEKWSLALRTHPWGGHDLTLDDGAWVVKTIGDWIERGACDGERAY